MKISRGVLLPFGAALLGWQGLALAAANLNIRAVDNNQVVPGITVSLVDSSGATVVTAQDDNNDGVVQLPVVNAGSYQIVTRAPNGAEQRTRVAVPGSGSHALRVNLAGGASAAAAQSVAVNRSRPGATTRTEEGISYDYFQISWIIDSEVEDFGGEDIDGDGIGFDASKSLGEYFYVRGTSWAPNYDDDVFTDTDFALTDWQSLSVGVHGDLVERGNTRLDVFLQGGYERLQVGGPLLPVPATGYGLSTGLRLQVNSFELDAYVRYADAEAQDVDVEPLLYGVDLRYRVTPNLSLSVGYADGDVEIDGNGVDEEPDLSMFTAGLRYNYGQPWRGGGSVAHDPVTSYNYLQFDYVVDGELDPNSDTTNQDNLDTDRGIGIDASYLLCENLFIRGTSWTFDYDEQGSVDDVVLNDMVFVGPGVRFGAPVGKAHIDAYLQATYDRINFAGFTADGYGGEVGLRTLLIPGLELDAWYRAGRSEGDVLGSSLDIDPNLWGVRLIMGPENAEKWSNIKFVIAYMAGELEVDDGTFDDDIDVDALSFGVRFDY